MDLNKLLEDVYVNPIEVKREETGEILAKEIACKVVKLVEVIEALGARLTSSAVDDRIIAMSLLGHILEKLNQNFLTEAELTFIVEFIHDRLKDQHQVIPKVILCILPIVQCSNLPSGSSSKLLRQIFQESNIQSHTQRHRRAFFLLIQHLLNNKIDELTSLGSDFVVGFLQSMDGEKDPRNLLLLFNIIPTILTHFQLGPFVEDFFEILSMYFPIDFTPTVGGPDAEVTTREELARNLHMCMSQTNQFSEYLVPLTLEKLESSVLEAKIDALGLLTMCCERSYSAEDLKPHLASIWHALRREIFMGGNEDVEKVANAFLSAAFKPLSEKKDIMETALNLILAECKHHLSEPELRLSQPACRILSSVAAGSESSCGYITSIIIPLLYEQFTTKTSNPERRGILGIMITMMTAIRKYPKLKLSSLLGKWHEILWMWFSLLTHSHAQFILLSLRAFQCLVTNESETRRDVFQPETDHRHHRSNSDLDDKHRSLLQSHLLTILQRESDQDEDLLPEIKSSAIATMELLATEYPNEVLQSSIPKLLDLINVDEPSETYFLALSSCSAPLQVGTIVIPSLVKILIETNDKTGDYEQLVNTLLTIVVKGTESEDAAGFVECASKHLETIVDAAKDARRSGKSSLYCKLAGIVRKIVQASSERKQEEIVNQFWNQSVVSVVEDYGILTEAFLASLRPLVKIMKKRELIKLLAEKTFHESETRDAPEDPMEMDALARIRLLANFLNKAEGDDFPKFLDDIEKLLAETLKIPDEEVVPMEVEPEGISPAEEAITLDQIKVIFSPDDRTRRVVAFFVWTIKALAMRGYESLSFWIEEKMIRLLNSSAYGQLVAEGFSTVLADSEESLNSKSFCTCRFLYKQRFFQISVPKLVQGYRQARHEVKPNFIRALTGQLRHVPQMVLQMELKSVVPLLVGSINYDIPSSDEKDEITISRNRPNAPLLLTSLTALYELLTPTDSLTEQVEKASPILEYYLDLVPRLLKLAQYKGFMEVRIPALKCLQRCAKFPTHVMVPVKEQVLRDLRPCLDDRKRLVRKEAVTCINIWTLTNAPGGV